MQKEQNKEQNKEQELQYARTFDVISNKDIIEGNYDQNTRIPYFDDDRSLAGCKSILRIDTISRKDIIDGNFDQNTRLPYFDDDGSLAGWGPIPEIDMYQFIDLLNSATDEELKKAVKDAQISETLMYYDMHIRPHVWNIIWRVRILVL